MKEKDKNNKKELSDFLRYSEGKMTDREKNTFERELQKDPFAEEASDGFSEISPESAEADISRLREQLKTRISHRSGMVYLRVAASVAVLMILSSVYVVIERNKSSKELSISVPKAQIEIAVPEKIKEPASKEAVITPEKKADQKADLQTANKVISRAVSDQKAKVVTPEKTETIPVEEKEADNYKVEDKMAAPAAAMIRQEPAQAVSDDSVVIVGYGNAKRAKAEVAAGKAEFDQGGYLSPQPVNGKDSFNKYIEVNIRKPKTFIEGQREIVVLSFLVKNTGAIDSIKVLRSPGSEFSEEAIRLIKEGPEWKPAVTDGKTIDDEVRLRIVFK